MKSTLSIGILAAVLLFGGVWWSKSLSETDSNIVAQNGLHWHPQLTIYVKGLEQEIPANIGIGPQYAGTPGYDLQMQMTPVHTHEDLPVIHLEFSGSVTRVDIKLGQFFKIWGKDMRSFGGNIQMTVNGVANTEYENYELKDGDKITLSYE